MASRVRKALLPLLVLTLPVLGSVTLAGATAKERAARREAVAASVAALPAWSLLDMRGAIILPESGPVAILYSRSDCVYCTAVTQAFDSIAGRMQLPSVAITDESRGAADLYRQRLRLRRVFALDRGGRWGRAVGLRAVPALIIRDRRGIVRISYGDRPIGVLQQALQSAR